MLFSLALRNVVRNFRRLAPMMFSIALIFALLVMGNAVLTTTVDSLYRLYAKRLSGDLTVSATAESNFTIFGSDQMLVGTFLTPPTLVGFDTLKKRVDSYDSVRVSAGLISSAARVEVAKKKQDLLLFGVDFEDYTRLVSGLELSEGRFPNPGEHGIVVQEHHFQEGVGKKALLTSGLGRNFTIREVQVTGSFSFPVDDKSLKQIALVDADTARALNGYLYGSGESPEITEEEQQALSGDLSDIFSTGDRETGEEPDGKVAIKLQSDLQSDQESGSAGGPAATDPLGSAGPGSTSSADGMKNESDNAAWNFLLISLHDREDIDGVASRLASDGYTEDSEFQVRPWSSSVGGNAQLAYYLQLMFNIGLFFVSFGAAVIAANALLLSILERREEIGTLRAVGATRLRVALLIFFETLLVVFFSALLGIGLGIIAVGRINTAGIVLDNQYINLLFGGKPVQGEIGPGALGMYLGAAFFLTLLSMLYPLKKALSISPVEAMAE